jgi:hypothetical protein
MLESLKQQIISAESIPIAILLFALTAISFASLYGIFRNFHRYRIINDTPTSRIRSAHQGYVELEGTGRLMQGTPIVSPLTKMQCLWYSYKIERRVSGRRDHSLQKTDWEKVESGVSDNLFLLDDDTGICVVDPEGATIKPSFSKSWFGSSHYPKAVYASSGSIFLSSGDYRYTEKRIGVGEELYLLGFFKTVGGRNDKLDKSAEVRELLASWKKRSEMLLARFDHNNDGEIDLQEWETARNAAEQDVEKSFSERLVQPEVHIISKPQDSSRPYVISVDSQDTISQKYRWYSVGTMLGFFLSGIAAVWVIGVRFGSG